MLWIILLLSFHSSIASEYSNSTTSSSHRNGKQFSLFSVVTFQNLPCQGTGNIRNGTCFTADECNNQGGLANGNCASGFGVCCAFIAGCGEQRSQNCTYFVSQGNEIGSCKLRICPANENICQLRLDFTNFVITGPSTITLSVALLLKGAGTPTPNGVVANSFPATTVTRCNTDSFSISGPGNSSPPVICGTNTGEHMYVEANNVDCNVLNFNINEARNVRSWDIKITQYTCDFDNLAPDGCTKYFSGAAQYQFISYNFNGGLHLANQRERICFRRERNLCQICFTTMVDTDFQLTNGGALNGLNNQCCGYGVTNAIGVGGGFDCIIIPGELTNQNNVVQGRGNNEFCGMNTGLKGDTLCTRQVPFMLSFYTDNFEYSGGETNGMNDGFRLIAFMNTC